MRDVFRCGRSKEVNTPGLIGYYVEALRVFRKRFRRKRPALFKSGQWHFQQDNHQSTSPSLSQTIWPRCASRQFLNLPIDQTLLDVTFGYSLSSEAYEKIEEMKEALPKVIDTLTQQDFHDAFQKLLERYNKWIAAGGNFFEAD